MSSPVPHDPPPHSDVHIASADDWGGLSRRIARRTTDLIAIGLIVAAGLTVAQRLIVWWKTDPAEGSSDPQYLFAAEALTPWGIGPGGAAIDLGELPLTLHRETFVGDREEASDRLRAACREMLTSVDGALVDSLPPPTDAERKLLRRLETHVTAETDPQHRWELHELSIPLGMVLGVWCGDVTSPPTGIPPEPSARLICWGLVLPIDDRAWTILRVTPRSSGLASASGDWPLPPLTRRGLALRDAVGGGLITFTGDASPLVWRTHFEQVARQRGWKLLTDWNTTATAWSAAWSLSSGDQLLRIDLQFTRTEAGWSGLIHISPIPSQPTPARNES